MAAIDDLTMRRSLSVAVAVAVAVLMGCISLAARYPGPAPLQYAALAVIDGRLTAVIAVCGRSTVSVDVYQDDNTMDDELHRWSVTVTLPYQVEDVEVELLGAARPGWEITPNEEKIIGSSPVSFKIVPLTSIELGHRYTLDSSAGGPEGLRAPAVTFTTDDLSRIKAGQVLTATDHKHSKVVPRDSFVNERCG